MFLMIFYAVDTLFYSKWNRLSDLLKQLELKSELESALRGTRSV